MIKDYIKGFTIAFLAFFLYVFVTIDVTQKARIEELEQMDSRQQKETIIKDLERVEFLLDEVIENQEIEELLEEVTK